MSALLTSTETQDGDDRADRPGRPRTAPGSMAPDRLAAAEMNYASRRIVEVQAPWIVDEQWHRR
jgi:hypothetical protein